jgi:hypothetical protein
MEKWTPGKLAVLQKILVARPKEDLADLVTELVSAYVPVSQFFQFVAELHRDVSLDE